MSHPHEGNDPVLECEACGFIAIAGTVFLHPYDCSEYYRALCLQKKTKLTLCQDCAAEEAERFR